MTIITDPLFYLLAIPAITALGLGKGGFAGVGMISTPLLALTMPPLQAAAIIANYGGIWLVRRTPTELFYRIAYVLMFLISVELIRSALVEMSRT